MAVPGREMDFRDSTVQNRAHMTRKGKSDVPAAQSQLARQQCTPWGNALGEEESRSDETLPPTTRSNHYHNEETGPAGGSYQVPDPSRAHNHQQNTQTEQTDRKLKVTASRINEGESIFVPDNGQPIPKGKVAQGSSRINSGNDIFGGPVENPRKPPPPVERWQQNSSAQIKGSHWQGYTSNSN